MTVHAMTRIETTRQGDAVRRQKLDAARQKRRRKRERKHIKIFGLELIDHLVPLALAAMGHGKKDLKDHAICEALLASWVQQQLELVMRDSRDEDLRVQFADIKREMISKGIA